MKNFRENLMHMVFFLCALTSIFAVVLMVAVMAVCTLPGATALMRTPLAAQVAETLRTHLARAYLVDT